MDETTRHGHARTTNGKAPRPEPMDDAQPGALTAVDTAPRAQKAAMQTAYTKPPAPEQTAPGGPDAVAQLAKQMRRIELLLEHDLAEIRARLTPPAPRPRIWQRPWRQRTKRALLRQTFAFALDPVQQLARAGQSRREYVCAGIKPQFGLSCRADRLPYGWVKIHARLKPQAQATLSLRLQLDTGAGFHAADSLALPMPNDADGHITDLRFIPPSVHEMRLDLISSTGEEAFVLEDFSMQEITKQEALAQMLLRAVRERGIPPSQWPRTCAKLVRKLRAVGVSGALNTLQHRGGQTGQLYGDWVKAYDTLKPADHQAIRAHIETFAAQPRISVIMPVYNPPEAFLRKAVASVQAQLYDNWELCIADDASSAHYVAPLLQALAAEDARIKFVIRAEQGHICHASNDALKLATGQFVTFLDHDDELREHALYLMAETLDRHPDAGLIYSDEDKIDIHGERHDPYFKPAWNPDLLRSQNYINHLSCYRRSLVEAVGNLRPGYEGSQDYDLALRATQQLDAKQIHHIPHVLYFWRAIAGSTAQVPEAKPYTFLAAQKALTDDLARRGVQAKVTRRTDGFFRTRYLLPKRAPLVSIIIPTRDHVGLLRQCIESITQKSTYPNYEIIVVDNDSAEPETHAYFETLKQDARMRVLPYHKAFNYAAINNAAADIAYGEVLCLLNNDIEIITEDWLEEMVGQALRPEIGAVGAKLYYGDRTLQHAGVVLGIGGVAGHAYKHLPGHDPGSFSRANLVQNYAGVTAACLVIRRATYQAVGGIDEVLRVSFNDVDFCLRVRATGLYNLWTPYAEMFHHESQSRGIDTTPAKQRRAKREQDLMLERWGPLLANDPFYNPNLTNVSEDFSLGLPPRAAKPWRGEGPMRQA